MKWNIHNIMDFLTVYQKYPALWNVNDKDYRKTRHKDEIFECLYCELDDKQLIGKMDMKQLKAKIKSIKDVYRQELHKIEKSVQSGCASDEVYTPKLAWFNGAYYLEDAVSTKSSNPKAEPDEFSETGQKHVTADSNNCEERRFKSKMLLKTRLPATPMERERAKKRVAYEKSPTELSEAILQLNKIAQNATEEKPYDQFGKFIAAELRQLPERQAVLLQQEIQNCIISFKLSSLENANRSIP
ncbi:uncharacterized protein LOC128740002 [Sabethes cyaneus]|uniref:uncharacterized protein LOC128740002 n=1 Tax=Sabethes cyaneus TaxID=53552 RepID=UPI00237EA374|nr:uncharacterized protein LOC128740002 [Sabethes cyaneus]